MTNKDVKHALVIFVVHQYSFSFLVLPSVLFLFNQEPDLSLASLMILKNLKQNNAT